jgi:hypothetical protein
MNPGLTNLFYIITILIKNRLRLDEDEVNLNLNKSEKLILKILTIGNE